LYKKTLPLGCCERRGEAAPRRKGRLRILIVDDNELNRKLLSVVFSAHGHVVVERANGLEALEALETSTFDALVSDVLMPGMDGYRLCTEIRRSGRFRNLPIVVVSSLYTSPADEKVARLAGADRFIPRPVSGETLLEALEEVCAASRYPEEEAPPTPDPEVLKHYSERLVKKLKEKSQELETEHARLVEGNENLRRANDALERDFSDSKRRGEEVQQLAFHDPLTGLPNRLLFNDRLTMALSQARRHQKKLATFFMDLDNFKAINDSMGHLVGDELLRAVAERLGTFVREEDTLARFGGDEFILLITGIASERDVATVSKKILETIRAPFHLDGRELSITLSVGVSVFPTDGQTPEILVRNADVAMYRSKRSGRNTFQLFTSEASPSSGTRLNIEAQLRNALRAGEFLLHYQPIVDLNGGQVLGVEALLRWQAGDGSMISPANFIPVAETSDLIIPISQWVLRSACSQFATWANGSKSRMTLAINLSTRVFQQPDLVGEVSTALEEAKLSPECLDLEITESSAMQNVEYSATMLRRLKDLGVHISLDDFGTGYSSLSYLKRLPIDRIKIDKSFVQNVAHDDDDAAIVSAVIAMTHRLKRKAVAEGVETKNQLAFLRREACDQGQGFLFSHPLPPSALERTLKAEGSQDSPFRHHFQA
jgi:diguanylate cyclase (GGDEF)-like protein